MENPNTSSSTSTVATAESTATPSSGNSRSSSTKESISQSKSRPRGKGRRKADPSKKIENRSSLQTTNTKRRQGLFSKAKAFCKKFKTAEVAVVTFTPGGKADAFARPSVDAVIDRYLYAAKISNINGSDHQQNNNINHGSSSSHRVDPKGKGNVGEYWWEDPIDGVSPREVQSYKKGLQGLRENVVKKLEEMRDERRMKHTLFGVWTLDYFKFLL